MLKSKKILLIILAVVLLLIIPTVVNGAVTEATETTETSTGAEVKWSYELSGSNATNLRCTNVASVTGSLTIPSTIDGYTVKSIGEDDYPEDGAFQDCKGLTGIVIPEGVITIGSYAFSGCTGLRSVTIPNSVTIIGGSAFRECTGLKEITIPNNVTTIGSYAFSGCSGLTKIVIPDSVTSLGGNSFSKCSGLKDVTLSKNLTILNQEVFSDCKSLEEISLPDNLTTIDTDGYSYCSPFEGCTSLKYIRIPENCVSIGTNAFVDCKDLIIFGKAGSVAEEYATSNNIDFELIENWDNRNSNSGEDISAPTVSSMYVEYSNVIGNYNDQSNRYVLPRNVEITILVSFSENIQGDEIPTLTIKFGTGENIDLTSGIITGNKIAYTYKIQEQDNGLLAAVSLAGGNITDYAGNTAELSTKEIKITLVGEYLYADGSIGATDQNPDESRIDRYISFPMMIFNGKGTLNLKSGVYDGDYTMYYQFIELSDEVYSKLEDLKEQYQNGEISYEEFITQFNSTVTQYDDTKWIKTEDGSFEFDLNQFTGQKRFALWVKLEMDDKTVYEAEVYTMNGSNVATNNTEPSDTNTKDPTIADKELPNTGRVILAWIIGVVAVFGIVAHIRYKKLYM